MWFSQPVTQKIRQGITQPFAPTRHVTLSSLSVYGNCASILQDWWQRLHPPWHLQYPQRVCQVDRCETWSSPGNIACRWSHIGQSCGVNTFLFVYCADQGPHIAHCSGLDALKAHYCLTESKTRQRTGTLLSNCNGNNHELKGGPLASYIKHMTD